MIWTARAQWVQEESNRILGVSTARARRHVSAADWTDVANARPKTGNAYENNRSHLLKDR